MGVVMGDKGVVIGDNGLDDIIPGDEGLPLGIVSKLSGDINMYPG